MVLSSSQEMQEFMIDKIRPDFADDHILAIKFIVATVESFEDADETSWYINPEYSSYLVGLDSHEYDADATDSFSCSDYFYAQAYGPKLASEFLPELLFMIPNHPTISVLDKYSEFRMATDITNLDDNERYEAFIDWFKDNKDN